MSDWKALGFAVFDRDLRVAKWAKAAHQVALGVASDPAEKARWLRHGRTWFVGVDALPNEEDGSIGGAALGGPWEALVDPPAHWHRAQLSITYPGYPHQDAGETDAGHRFRIRRHSAHVDGILLEEGRRFLREPHSFVLGLPLNVSDASPLMVWPESHLLIGPALRMARQVSEDITEAYKAIRKTCFDTIEPVPVRPVPGQSILLHRHLLHGVAPWLEGDVMPPEGRMIAYFRPQMEILETWF